MKNNSLRLAILLSIATGVTGCSSINQHIKEQKQLTSKTPEPIINMNKIGNSVSSYKKNVSQVFYQYDFSSLEEGDLKNLSSIKVKKFSVKNSKLRDVLETLSDTYGFGLVILAQSPQTLDRRVSLTLKNTDLSNLLKQIEIVGNVDLYEKNGVVYLSDTLTVSTSFTRLEFPGGKADFYAGLKKKVEKALSRQKQEKVSPVVNTLKDQISKLEAYLDMLNDDASSSSESDSVSEDGSGLAKNAVKELGPVPLPSSATLISPNHPPVIGGVSPIARTAGLSRKQKDEFREILDKRISMLKKRLVKNERLYFDEDVEIKPTVLVDPDTGLFSVKGDPNLIRQSTEMLAKIVNSALSSSTIKITFLSVNDSKAREFGVNASKIVQGLYTLSAGGSVSFNGTTLDFQRSVTDSNGDKFDVGIKMLEKAGIIRSQTVNSLTVFNGFSTELSKKKEVGNWIPGDIQQTTNTTNGVATTNYSESKPTFEKDTVGRTLKITPRINLDEKRINLLVDFVDSSIYAEETFTWERSAGDKIFPTQIKKPLKTESKIKSAVVLSEGERAILTGLDSDSVNMSRSGLPGAGETPVLQDIGSNSAAGSSTKEIVIISAEFPNKKRIIKVKSTHF